MSKTITFIGNGNMALSIAMGLRENYNIEVVGRKLLNLDAFEKAVDKPINKHTIDQFNIDGKNIILCVKPANIISVGSQLKGEADILYSVLAGTTLNTLNENIRSKAYIRTMPNLAATVKKSMTTITGDRVFKDESLNLFNTIGHTLWVESEKELDIATALAGSGPAYLSLIAEAFTDGAVKQGIKRSDAMVLMRGLFDGFGTLIQKEHPALLKDSVMSPGGTTAAGYSALEDAGVRSGCIDAVTQAYKRAKEL